MDIIDDETKKILKSVMENIKGGIECTYSSKMMGSCLILIYAGIDAMAYLNMPSSQDEVQRSDFVDWADRYINLPPLQGIDLYGARCAVVHTFGSESRISRKGKAREIVGYIYENVDIESKEKVPEVWEYDSSKDHFVVKLESLKASFYEGVANSIADMTKDEAKYSTFKKRIRDRLYDFVPTKLRELWERLEERHKNNNNNT